MAYEQQPPDNGTIFLSPTDSDNPKAPKFKGKGKDDQGREIEVAFWEGVSRAGKPWKMVRIGPPYKATGEPRKPHPDTPPPRQQRQEAQPSLPGTAPVPPEDEEIPF